METLLFITCLRHEISVVLMNKGEKQNFPSWKDFCSNENRIRFSKSAKAFILSGFKLSREHKQRISAEKQRAGW